MPAPTFTPMDVAQTMYAQDATAQHLGIQIQDVQNGQATLTMVVRDSMTNGHGICHGGMIFSLADTAFAYACNSYNHNVVASACHIDFIAPAQQGDILTAVAQEQSRRGRSGIYDISIHNQTGTLIALFRGKSAQIPGEIIPSSN